MRAEILSIGTELLLGQIVNTNAQFLAQQLALAGVELYHQTVVGDNAVRLHEQLAQSFSRSDLVVTTGGLGPTADDLTKEVVAQYFGRPLHEDAAEIKKLEAMFERFGSRMTPNNRKQALLPEGAQFLTNDNGTASGIWLESGGKIAVLLPGPPGEMRPMFLSEVMPRLSQLTGHVIRSSTVHLFGIGESAVENMLAERIKNASNPTIAPYAKTGEVQLRVTAMARGTAQADALIAPVVAELVDELGEYVYGVDIGTLEQALVTKLTAHGLRVATAESCTGGLISKRITDIAGSSAVFDCGVCTYSNAMKEALLGVSGEVLRAHGAVSPEVATQMAEGVRALAGADIGISTTGVAGPGGGSEEKPVGLVYIAVATRLGSRVLTLAPRRQTGDVRAGNRVRAASTALHAALCAADGLAPK